MIIATLFVLFILLTCFMILLVIGSEESKASYDKEMEDKEQELFCISYNKK